MNEGKTISSLADSEVDRELAVRRVGHALLWSEVPSYTSDPLAACELEEWFLRSHEMYALCPLYDPETQVYICGRRLMIEAGDWPLEYGKTPKSARARAILAAMRAEQDGDS